MRIVQREEKTRALHSDFAASSSSSLLLTRVVANATCKTSYDKNEVNFTY